MALALLHGHLQADNASRGTGEFVMPADQSQKSSSASFPREGLVPYLRNGDFETSVSETMPAFWTIFREGFSDTDPALAHSGSRSIRSSFLYGWFQELLIPVSPFQTFTLHGYAMREFADERAGARAPFFRADGSYIKDSFGFSPVDAPPDNYGTFWVPLEVPPSAVTTQLYVRGQSAQSWLRFDDLRLYKESFSDDSGTFGEPWTVSGEALAANTTISLITGSQASQRVAVGIENQAYFTWGKYETAIDTELTVQEEWLPRTAQETTSTTYSLIELTAPSGTFLADPGRPVETGTGLCRVTLSTSSTTPITISEIHRGFAKVEPAILTAGPASPDGPLRLTAAWPGHLTSATISILTETGLPVASPTTTTLHGTTVRADWDPGDTTSGTYKARFVLESLDGSQVSVDRKFQLVREDNKTSSVPAYRSSEFLRGIWMFALGHTSAADTYATFQNARNDGFTWTIVVANLNKLTHVREAAEAANMPFVVFIPEAISLFQAYTQRSWFSKADYIGRLKQLFAPVSDSPLFQGVYVMDEPSTPEAFEVLQRTTLSVAQDGSLGSPFTVFFGTTSFENLTKAQPATGLIDIYPYHLGAAGDPTRALLNIIEIENTRVRNFDNFGRDMWLLPQAFINRIEEDFYPVPPGMYTGQLGAAVLAGAKGTVPFFYNSNPGAAQGMRGPNLISNPMLDAFREFNTVVERLSPILMPLNIPTLQEDVPYPFAVSTATDPDGATYTFVLNADDFETRTLRVQFQTPLSNPPTDLVALRQLPLEATGAVNVGLGPGQWAMFSAGNSATISGMEALPVEPPDQSTFELPITHEFTVPRLDGQGQPVLALDFSSNASTLAASVGWFAFEPAEPMVFHLGTTGTVTREPGPLGWPAERYGVTADDLYYAASPYLGRRLISPGGFFNEPVSSYMGHTGGAVDVITDGGNTWISIAGFGIRQLFDTQQGLQSAGVGRTTLGPYTDLFGPFGDGSVTSIVGQYGVTNIKPGKLDESHHIRKHVYGTDRNAALSGRRQLAVPRHQYGVGLLQLNANGEVETISEIAKDALDATAAAWIYDTVLAIADGYQTIRFYDINGTEATPIVTWRPAQLGENYMLSLSAKVGRLAIGTLNGQVLVADTTALRPSTAVSADWQLLE